MEKELNMLDYALAYAELGWAVVFLAEREKTPLTRHGYADATKDPDKIKRWWSLRPEANIGIRVGRESGIVVLDVDPRNGGDETLARLSELYSPIPTTPTVATGGGGLHMYFAWHEDIQNREIGPGLELKADSGYVVAPPSVHPSGNRYAWVEGLDPWSVGLASMPVWLSTAKSETANIDLPLRVRRWDLLPIGRRNTSLFLLALVASTLGMSTTALHRYLELLVDNLVEQTPGDAIGLREIEQMVRWNASHDIGELLSVEDPESDKGAAEMLSIFSDGRYLYCPEIKSFLRWHQGRWERMDTGLGIVYELASLLRITAMSLGEQLDHDMLKRMWKLSSCLSSEPKAVRVLRSVSTTNMVRSIDEFDDDPYLLNCRNGIVDLRTGEIRTQTPDDLVMHSTGVDYDPTAESQLWNRFLSEATGGDPALVAYLQRLAGYCATGLTELETFWLLLGPAGSGKSTFTAAIRTALGSYARHVSSGLFAVSGIGSERPTPELARLKGCRIVLATELEPAATLNSPVVKAVVSGEEIVVRELYCPPFSYRPICKILLAANEAMKMSATDSGLWRRLRRVPFEHVVPEERRSPELKAKLTDPTADDGVHVRAVLRWIVDGAVMWLRDRKLDPPVYVHDLTEELRDELDPISEWIQECCDRSDRRAVTPKDELWKSYLQWCEQEAIKPMDCRIWGKYLKRWCVRIERPRLGGERKRMVVGIRLLDRGSVQPKTVDFSESGQDPFDDLD